MQQHQSESSIANITGENFMSFRVHGVGMWLACALLATGLSATSALAADKKDGGKQTLTGEVSDAMCGAKHMMEGGKAACTKACVDKGSKYALVVGDKVYTLEGGDTAALSKLAGEKAKVTGTVKGDTIQVSSIASE
jgi:hypothetical protein